SAARCRSASWRRRPSGTATSSPRALSAIAVARPIPRDAPVTSAPLMAAPLARSSLPAPRPAGAILLQDDPAALRRGRSTTPRRDHREATTRHDAWHRDAETGTVERGAGPVPGPWHALGRAAVVGVPVLRPIEKGHHDHGDHDR